MVEENKTPEILAAEKEKAEADVKEKADKLEEAQ